VRIYYPSPQSFLGIFFSHLSGNSSTIFSLHLLGIYTGLASQSIQFQSTFLSTFPRKFEIALSASSVPNSNSHFILTKTHFTVSYQYIEMHISVKPLLALLSVVLFSSPISALPTDLTAAIADAPAARAARAAADVCIKGVYCGSYAGQNALV
jgi:hypothetical protein